MNEAHENPLYGFGHNMVQIDGTLYLCVNFGTPLKSVVNIVKFYVINTPSSYNTILGRLCLASLGAATSTPHLKVKFPTPKGIGKSRETERLRKSSMAKP